MFLIINKIETQHKFEDINFNQINEIQKNNKGVLARGTNLSGYCNMLHPFK